MGASVAPRARELHWRRIDAGAYHTTLGAAGHISAAEILGGPYGTASFVVNYGDPLRLSPLEGTVYAQTNVYSPSETDAVMILATPNPRAAFLNGGQVYSRWLRPLYNRLIDGFAARVPVHLRPGWNSLLLKFLHNPENPASPHFSCRIENPDGTLIEGLIGSCREFDARQTGARRGYRWLRFPVPPVAGAFQASALTHAWLSFVDERKVDSSREIPLPRGAQGHRDTQEGPLEVWVKAMSDGSKVVGLFNRSVGQRRDGSEF